jgi:ketosteroid isomerase-like protein
MSQANVEVVRKPLRAREPSSRTFEQRLFLRLPGLADRCLRLLARLPPTARLRQAVMWRGVQQSVEAFNRRDLDALTPFRDPDCELHAPHEVVESGLMEPSYRGHAGYHRYVSEVLGVWGDDMRAEPVELIDLGDRFVLLYNMGVRARASGVPMTGEMATVAVLNGGKTIRQHDYLAHAEALEAVGLRE